MTFGSVGLSPNRRTHIPARSPRSLLAACAVLTVVCCASGAVAQLSTAPKPPAAIPAANTDDTVPLSLKDQEKQIRKIRLKYLGSISKTEIRQIGIAKLREFTDPLLYPKMLEIFRRDKADVRTALLDHFSDQKSEEGDATLAWAAVFEQDAWYRAEARTRLVKRIELLRKQGFEKRALVAATTTTPVAAPVPTAPAPTAQVPVAAPAAPAKNVLIDPDVPWRVKKIISSGVQQSDDTIAGAAGDLAGDINLFEIIPLLINTQVGGGGGGAGLGGGGGDTGDGRALAYIIVGSQQAFVSDLTPVVGDSAVGFDPTVSVLTTGTVLRIDGAVVITYRTIIHYSLTRLANAAWDGRKTEPFGFDQRKWADWYNKDLLPYREQVAAGTAPATK